MPIVGGREIEVGRTVEIGDLRATYTRIEPTSNGTVWHFDTAIRLDNVTTEGVATSELRSTNTNALEYRFTQTSVDTEGNALSQVCIGPLTP